MSDDMVDVRDLHQLLERWRQWTEDDVSSNHDLGYKDGREDCADELEELIEGRELSESGDN